MPERSIEAPFKKSRASLNTSTQFSKEPVLSSGHFAKSNPLMPRKQRNFLAPDASTDIPTIYGSVVYSDDWEYGNPLTGLYSISFDNGVELNMIAPEADGFNGGVAIDGVYYATTSFSAGSQTLVRVGAYDIATGEALNVFYPSGPEAMGIDMCVDPTDGKVYGITYNATADGLQLSELTYTPDNVTVNKIADLTGNWAAIAASNTGELYGIIKDYADGASSGTLTGSTLVKFNKQTGAFTRIGATGMKPFYNASACIDPNTNRFFWNVNEASGASFICEVDLATGETYPLADLPGCEEVCGMYIPAIDNTNPKAPSAAENLTAVFSDNGKAGYVYFTIPEYLYDGTPGSGSVNYTIAIGGIQAAQGIASYGEEMDVEVTTECEGLTTISVVLSNEAGDGPRAVFSCFIGHGVPQQPANVALVYTDGQSQLSWDAVTTSADGGYVNPDEVAYKVVLYPAGEVVADNLTQTTFTHLLPEPEELSQVYYGVSAIYDGKQSQEGFSNNVLLGAYPTPFEETFVDDNCLDYFTIIDNNADGKTFTLRGGQLTVSYNSSLDMDDYLISPAIKLEAGNSYHISIDARNEGTRYGERFELLIGTEPTVAGMQTQLIPPTDMISGVYATYGADFIPSESGKYYIGVHGCSDKDKNVLYVTNLKVGDGMLATVPAAPEEFVAVADTEGEHTVAISGKIPALDLAGNELPEVNKVELYRNSALITTWEDVTPGQQITYTDAPSAAGEYVYGLVAYSPSGQGNMARSSCFVGVDIPSVPTNIKVEEPEGNGIVKLSWDAVEKDWQGRPVNPAKVTYTIYGIDSQGELDDIIVENLSATEYTFQAIDDTSVQSFVQFGITSNSESGESPIVGTGLYPVGPSYPGLHESFANGTLSYIFGLRGISGQGIWNIFNDDTFSDVASQDADNGFLAYYASGYNDSMGIHTGKISLVGFDNPVLSYYVYPIDEEDENRLQVLVRENQGEWQTLATQVINQLGAPKKWNKVILPLADYAGKDIQIEFVATCKGAVFTLLDNIYVGDLLSHDMAVKAVSAPAKVKCESDYEVEVTVMNEGAATAEGYSVEIYDGDNLLTTIEGDALESLASATLTASLTMPKFAVEPLELNARVAYDTDQNLANNESDSFFVMPILSALPSVNNLAAEVDNDSVTLTWDLPETEIPAEGTTYDFEDAESFAHEYDGWQFIDVDQSPVGGMANVTLPGITGGVTTSSFFVLDSTDDQYNESFDAHSGHKYLASLVRYDDKQVDDWAISPALSGAAQTISFWAKSYHPSYLEKVEIWISKAGSDISDFELLPTIPAVPYAWTEYSYDLPDGTNHFAIRSCAVGAFLLMIDDVTFTKAGETRSIEITGYNIYRDEELIATVDKDNQTYTDSGLDTGTYTYIVAPRFDIGEGKPAFVQVATNPTGIDMVNASSLTVLKDGVRVNDCAGEMVVVVAADGKVIFQETVNGSRLISLTPGVYVVRLGNKSEKVIIR